MKLLVTGASGLYGSKLAQLAGGRHEVSSLHSAHSAIFGKPIQADVTDAAKIFQVVADLKPDVVVHAASLTDVDKCEQNKQLAWQINVEGTKNVAKVAEAVGSYLLYVSTDYVFDGSQGCYRETDQPSPISYYAYTKLKAEEAVAGLVSRFCIARPSVIYGALPAAGKVNFALWLLNKLKAGERVNVFVDQWNSPTLNSSLAEMTLELVERGLTGVYHVSGATRISRFDFAKALAQRFELNQSLIVPTAIKDMPFPAKRPRDSSLDTSKATAVLKCKPLGVEAALDRLKSELA